MKERRPLTGGVNPPAAPVDPEVARKFIFGETIDTEAKPNHVSTKPSPPPASANPHKRVPISTRIREEFAEALKRASLQRQIDKVEPNTLQDILEEAVEPWLRNNGYIR